MNEEREWPDDFIGLVDEMVGRDRHPKDVRALYCANRPAGCLGVIEPGGRTYVHHLNIPNNVAYTCEDCPALAPGCWSNDWAAPH